MKGLFSVKRLVMLALLLAIGTGLILGRDLDPAVVETQIIAVGLWAPLVFVLIFAAATVLFLPGAVFGLIGGVVFGPIWGTVWTLTGATLGCALAFLAARYLIADWVRQKASGRAAEVIKGIDAEGWRFVVFVRLVPLFPFNLLNYLLGLTKLRFWEYLLTSAICMVPGTAAFTYLGHAGRDAMTGGEGALGHGMIGLGLLVAVLYGPRLIKMVRRRGSWIECQELAAQIKRGAALSLIDVRSSAEFNGPLGHIPNAINIPLEKLHGIQGDASDKIILICLTDKRSEKAAALLSKKGFNALQILRGGMRNWPGQVDHTMQDATARDG